MGCGRADDPWAEARRAAAHDRYARCHGSDPVHRLERLPVAHAAGEFPPISTVRGYFYAWRDSGLLAAINQLLVMAAGEIAGKQAQSTAGIIDSQSVKTTESGGICGCDAGKKIKGRKRHIVTDTLGFLLFVMVHGADVQDRDGAPELLRAIRFRHPWLRHIFADGGYAGDKLKHAMAGHGRWTMEIVKRSDAAKGFVVLPRRWVVERTFA